MVVFVLTADLLQRALRAGVADVIEVSADDAELFGAIERASSRIRTRVAASTPARHRSEAASAPRGRVTTVFCTKGGAGKSVIAINLAVALARQTISPVVLVDADLQFGDVALMLGLQPVHTILDAVQAGDRIDAGLLGNLMLRHPASGLFVLAAPTEPESADQIGRDDLARILAVLRENCAHIVIDTSANFGEVTLAALKEADDILVLASLDVMSIKSARVGLQTMRVLGIPFERFKFVLNRANTRVGLSVADAGRALEMKVDIALPSELAVAESVNRGVPVLISSPRSKFTKGINELAAMLSAPEPAARKP
jgi:pilus assembly protein CpaE